MIRQKTARSILYGIAIVRILVGSLLVIAALGMLMEMEREDLAVPLVGSAVLLPLGVYFAYTSYRVLRRRAFVELASEIPGILPGCVFLVIVPLMFWADTLPNEKLARNVGLAATLGGVIVYCLGVSVCKRFASKLINAANGQPAEELAESGEKHACPEGREN